MNDGLTYHLGLDSLDEDWARFGSPNSPATCTMVRQNWDDMGRPGWVTVEITPEVQA